MQAPADLAQRRFDLLVVGGGINGAAIARDAALRGLSVCLVDKNDWGWGTSAKSSKLAHGGLRYLELFEFGLVHEALQDREMFLRHAPHLVRPLRFLYPIYPHVAARRAVRAGLFLYDQLSRGKSVPNRKYHGRKATLQLAPGLNGDGLRGGATYYDAQIQHVERLVAEMVWDAKQHGAVCLNHTTVKALRVGEGPRRVLGATVELPDGRTVDINAAATVNAAGCWVDDVLGPLGEGRPPKVRKTKGVHLVVPRFSDVALIVKAASDGRTFFILPWQDTCVIGTTDTDYTGDAGDAAADADDVTYLLDEAAHYFPEAPLDRIRYTYAGVRALVNEQGVTESNVTRRHILYDHEARDGVACLWSLQGGKITTARTLAEEAVDRICRGLGKDPLAKHHPTRTRAYPGGPLVPWARYRDGAVAAAAEAGIPVRSAEHLVDTYGARWRIVLASDARREARRPLHADLPHLGCEVTFAIDEEDATTLADVALRRTSIGLAAGGNPQAAHLVLEWMAERLGWDVAERERQWAAYEHEVRVLAIPEVSVATMRNPPTQLTRPPPKSAVRKP